MHLVQVCIQADLIQVLHHVSLRMYKPKEHLKEQRETACIGSERVKGLIEKSIIHEGVVFETKQCVS